MARFPAANEPVVRHRGGGRDENGQLRPDQTVTLMAIAVAPGAIWSQAERLSRGRDGEDIACTVYFPRDTDLVNSDELTVRGQRFRVIVNDWHLDGPLGGLEVLCIRGQG